MKAYRKVEWQSFRLQVIRADGGVCCRCGKGEPDGATLQVHHKFYVPGRQPWEYDHADCETLCQGCHAVEHGIIPPQSGWECVGYLDLGDLIGNCELCDTALRYTFLVHHRDWYPLEVGIDCCDRLTDTVEASEHVRIQKSQADKLKRFLRSKRWSVARDGSQRITRKGHEVHVVSEGDKFKLRIDWTTGRRRFASDFDAKVTAFELLESGKIDDYFNRPRHGRLS